MTLRLQVVVLRYFQLDLNPIYDFDVARTEVLPEVVHVGEVHGTLDALERLVDVVVDILDVFVEMRLVAERRRAHLQFRYKIHLPLKFICQESHLLTCFLRQIFDEWVKTSIFS